MKTRIGKSIDVVEREGITHKVALEGKNLAYTNSEAVSFTFDLGREFQHVRFRNDLNEVFLASEELDFYESSNDGSTVALGVFCLRENRMLEEEFLGGVGLMGIACPDDYTLVTIVKQGKGISALHFNPWLKKVANHPLELHGEKVFMRSKSGELLPYEIETSIPGRD